MQPLVRERHRYHCIDQCIPPLWPTVALSSLLVVINAVATAIMLSQFACVVPPQSLPLAVPHSCDPSGMLILLVLPPFAAIAACIADVVAVATLQPWALRLTTAFNGSAVANAVLGLCLAVLASEALGWEAVVAPSVVLWIRVGPLPRLFAWMTAEIESFGSGPNGAATASGCAIARGGDSPGKYGYGMRSRVRGSVVQLHTEQAGSRRGLELRGSMGGWKAQLESSAVPWVESGGRLRWGLGPAGIGSAGGDRQTRRLLASFAATRHAIDSGSVIERDELLGSEHEAGSETSTDTPGKGEMPMSPRALVSADQAVCPSGST